MADLPFGFSSGDDPERDDRKKDPDKGSQSDPFGFGGGEFDMSGTSLKSTNVGIIQGAVTPAANVTEIFGAHTNWIATSTVRLGIAKDHWLFYSKTGAAFAHENYGLGLSGANQGFGPVGNFGFASTANDTRVGWTVGTGVEWAFSDNWSAKVEYDYVYFGSKATDFSGVIANPGGGAPITNATIFNTNNTQSVSEVKFGINYKFTPGFLLF